MEKQALKQNILEKALSDGPSEILRPLYNSNVTKVYKMVSEFDMVYRIVFIGIPTNVKIVCFACIF